MIPLTFSLTGPSKQETRKVLSIMISNPQYGWCNFKLGNFEGTPSYLTDVPLDLLDAFLDYHRTGMGIAWFDEEGSEFTLVINPYSLFIIAERDEKPTLYDFSELNIGDLEKELVNDIEKDFIHGWSEFTIDNEKAAKYGNNIQQKLAKLKGIIHYE